ncbi:MAG: transcriptional regulator [Gomphosphaeria aponina SAG 52.96 = DSM 107014]|uniref:Transcriptional regulator n=1 Tax=Gomphosphaeria aponina SAG 52.96 = DSM 107014 TaxID=1521640 RepID=A0A941JNQ5_9CHRO|nr:transcriptional regulator [Gomphosphaeria aponina SAG 52.96 = DSM 107014]
MRLKDFCETFKSDFQEREFVVDYLQDCLEEGGITLFISALQELVKFYQINSKNPDKSLKQNSFLSQFLECQNPTFSEVYQVLKILELDLKLQLSSLNSTVG